MWALRNRTAYAAERNWTRDKEGVHWWIVAVRATFDIARGGRITLAEEQAAPLLVPEYFGEPGVSSLRYDSDLLAAKPGTDVLVNAHAHAPEGKPAPTVPVSLRVGRILKELLVHGERVYYEGGLGLSATAPRPFLSRPIRYELAFGGSDYADPAPKKHRIDDRNPIGRGFATSPTHLVNTPAPGIEYAQGAPAKMGPAGFGPIDASWMPRRALAGTYDAKWAASKKPLLPDDYDPAFALSAPRDQRSDAPLSGGERIELRNMTPDGILQLELPHVTLNCTSRFGRRHAPHEVCLTTVVVEPEEHRLSLVWQSTLRVAALEVEYLDETTILDNGSLR